MLVATGVAFHHHWRGTASRKRVSRAVVTPHLASDQLWQPTIVYTWMFDQSLSKALSCFCGLVTTLDTILTVLAERITMAPGPIC